MKKAIFLLICLIGNVTFSQNISSEEIKINPFVDGVLQVPTEGNLHPLVIIIAGSGPTDRDGNSPMTKNNSLKYLAEGLNQNKIATFRFDKRTVKMSQQSSPDIDKIVFDDFVKDMKQIIEKFKNDSRFSKIILAGHSKGSLVGMLAAVDNPNVDAFISIAGAGQAIDYVIVEQLHRQMPQLAENARQSFDDMKSKGVSKDYLPLLASIFNPNIQPFMLTWMKYNPQEEIAKLNMPVFIINGTEDVQINTDEAQLLHKASPESELLIIENMNHVFKRIETGDTMDNGKSYNEPQRPIMTELTEGIVGFIKSL